MLLSQIIKILDAEPIVNCNKDIEIKSVCSCDLMSDVLAFVKEQSMLLTGLNNTQTIRTAEMMDMHAVILVRGKNPENDVIELAKAKDIALLKTDLTMFIAAGKLYSAGLICEKQ